MRRSQTYWLLARLVLEPPGARFIAELERLGGESRPLDDAPLAAELAEVIAGARAAPGAEGLHQLAVEFTRLFRGLGQNYGPPPPFESLARGESLPGNATQEVAKAYRQAGFEHPAPEAGPEDHAGAELRFMALLCLREGEAWRAGDREAAAAWLAREERFLDRHLLAWLPGYCECIAAEARVPFYAASAKLLAAACRLDREDVSQLVGLAAKV